MHARQALPMLHSLVAFAVHLSPDSAGASAPLVNSVAILGPLYCTGRGHNHTTMGPEFRLKHLQLLGQPTACMFDALMQQLFVYRQSLPELLARQLHC